MHYIAFLLQNISLSPNALLTESVPISIEQVEWQSFGVLDHSDLLVASNLYHPGNGFRVVFICFELFL